MFDGQSQQMNRENGNDHEKKKKKKKPFISSMSTVDTFNEARAF